MDYVPKWVKSDKKRFKRVMLPTGGDLWNLSSHCKENLDADKKAFNAYVNILKSKRTEHTVHRHPVGKRIRNFRGSDRDYGPEAQSISTAPYRPK